MATGGPAHTQLNRAIETVQQTRAFHMKLDGYTHAQIAAELGISKGTVANRLAAAQAEYVTPALEEWRTLECQRLDSYLLSLHSQIRSGSIPAIQTALRIAERRAKLLGLDAPVQVEATVTQTTQEDLELAQIIREAKAKNATEEARLRSGEAA